jgi:methylthioribose-1-phosphate isomerase
MYLAHAAAVPFRVFVGETRPLLQGSRLTAWELEQAGIDVTLICDTMVARLMDEGAIDLVVVGADRVTRNGDTVNKIGTGGIAILAQHFGIPFYVALPGSTYDASTECGSDVVIGERDGDEVRTALGHPTAPAGIKVRNPAFDVTPHRLVTGFITNVGLLLPPFETSLRRLAGA